jgi:hypothetical protein
VPAVIGGKHYLILLLVFFRHQEPSMRCESRLPGSILSVFVITALASVAIPTAVLGANTTTDPWKICGQAIAEAERAYNIPRNLLLSIAHAETARQNKINRRYAPWPWTVMAKGRGRHFSSKADAISAVQTLKTEDIRNIDVGCLQVNLRYHPKAFTDLEDAFAPKSNAKYAASFLRDLFRSSGSWPNAVARYHSSTYRQNRQYKIRVLTIWRRFGGT